MDLLDEFFERVKEVTDAPDIFIQACGYFLISTAMGVKVDPIYFKSVNVWFMFSSIPWLTRRSTLISDLTVPLLKRSYALYLQNEFGVDEKEARKVSNYMILETGTVEGLADDIIEAIDNVKMDRFAIVSPEFGGVLRAAQKKDYLAGLFQFLSKLYSGEEHRQSLSKRKKQKSRYIPPGLYVTALLGIQEPRWYLTREQFEQGLMRRIIFIYQKPEHKNRWISLFDAQRRIIWEEIFDEDTGLVAELAERIQNFTSPGIERVVVEYKGKDFVKFREMYDNLEKYAEDSIKKDPQNLLNYFQVACISNIPRLAILNTLARHDEPIKKGNEYVIYFEYQDFERALEFIKSVYQFSRDAILELDYYLPKKLEPLPVTGKVDHTLEIIKKAGKSGITDSELLKAAGIYKVTLKEILLTLAKREDIYIFQFDNKEIRFFYRDYKDFGTQMGGKLLSPRMFDRMW
jgi:tetratricopeptide (TPR) repeat protein